MGRRTRQRARAVGGVAGPPVRDHMARVPVCDDVWADFRAAAGARPLSALLAELVEGEARRCRRERIANGHPDDGRPRRNDRSAARRRHLHRENLRSGPLVRVGAPGRVGRLRVTGCARRRLRSILNSEPELMTFSIFDGTGNLIDAFTDRAAALHCLAGIGQAEPEAAGEVFLIAQDADAFTVGATVLASSVSTPA